MTIQPRDTSLAHQYCIFCQIIVRKSPADILYEDADVVVFRNRLRWVPVMLLAVPRKHMTQSELWGDPVIARVSQIAVALGRQHCPNGFRLLGNFGMDAMQSQDHGHMHIIGGVHLGPYA